MSEYHSFSLVEHLPASRSTKKSATDQQQQHPQQQHRFSHHTFDIQSSNQFSSNSNNKHDILSMDDNTDQMMKSDDWQNQSNSFQSFDSLLNNMSNYNNHTRHHTAPVNSNDYHNLFEFLPFDDASHNLMVSNEGNDDIPRHTNEFNSPGSTNNNTMQHGIQLQDSSSIYVNRATKDKNPSMDNSAANNTASSNSGSNTIAGFNDHENNLYSFNHNEPDKPRTMMPYYDSMDNNPKEPSIMSSHLSTSFASPTASSPSPTATQASSPAYRISNLSLVPQPIQTPSILEFQPSAPSRISSSVSSRMMQGMVNVTKMKPAIQAYLGASDPLEAGERTVIIMTSKVAQKSYGTEKRFLCPPPTTILVGSSWWTPPSISKQQSEGAHLQNASFRDRDNILRAPPNLTICISGESTGHQSGRIEWYSASGALVGQTGSTSNQKLIQPANPKKTNEAEKSSANDDWYRNTRKETVTGGRCVLKRLYINDADEKRKKVECLIKVQLANGLMLGTLSSRGIKVISKPSKKRQSVKNIELCIYHGTTVSLFNRIRSQTVSTKYLGVSSTSGDSSIFDYPGRLQNNNTGPPNSDTCFVARTGSWDPFIVWIVDPSHHGQTEGYNASGRADEYIGCPSLVPTIPYPNPPTIALKNQTNQPLAIRYNQHIVLQCLTTGLVSPVMIIRKVDKASTVVGGARCPDEIDPSFSGGGEFGDEVLGDPVSQLHKIALQIVHHENIMQQQAQQAESQFYFPGGQFNVKPSDSMMPQMTKGPVTYLACLNDLVGTHKTNDKRTPIKGLQFNTSAAIAAAAAASECYNFTASSLSATLNSNTTARKRRVSMMEMQPNFGLLNDQQMQVYNNSLNELDNMSMRRRVSSLNDTQRFQPSSPHLLGQRSHSVSAPSSSPFQDRSAAANRKNSLLANGGQALAEFGAYWSEDVTDAAVWTIVGTECARYTFWAPPYLDENKQQENQITAPLSTPFPCLTHFVISNDGKRNNNGDEDYMTVSGENFTRDLQIWFGDIKAPFTEYRSREMLVCRLPPREELLQSVGLNRVHDVPIQETIDQSEGHLQPRLPYSIRILLIRGDGVVYKTSRSYSFS